MTLVALVLGLILLIISGLLYRYTGFFAYHLQKHSVKRLENLRYVEGSDDPRHLLDVYLPKSRLNFPVVHFVHGGYWNSSSKNHRQWLTGLYGNLGCTLARQGIGVVVSNYHLLPASSYSAKSKPRITIDDQIADVAQSIGWTLQHTKEWGGNGQIYMMGHSSGAHIISLLGANPKLYQKYNVNAEKIKGYIALSPILDIADMVKSHDAMFNRKVSFVVFGKNPKVWQKYSPLQYFVNQGAKVPKLLLAIGELDFKYIRQQVPAAFKQIQKSGLDVNLHIIPGYNHTDLVTRYGHPKDQLTPLILEFINH